MDEPKQAPPQPSTPPAPTLETSPDAPEAAALEEAIQSSLQTVDQELASLEAALRSDFTAADEQPSPPPAGDAAAPAALGGPSEPADPVSPAPAVRTSESPDPAAQPAMAASPPQPPPAVAVAPTATTVAPPSLPARLWSRTAQPTRWILQRSIRYAAIPLRAAVWILCIVDVPFARLGYGVKHVIGSVGIATSLIAALTWLAGPLLIHPGSVGDTGPAPHTAVSSEPPAPADPPAP